MTDQQQRPAMIETAFLRWLCQQTEMHPLSGNFRTDPTGIVDGEQVTVAELSKALDALHARGLITDESGMMGRLARVEVTPEGKLCLIDYDGDVRSWQVATKQGNVTFQASGNVQAAVNSINVRQTMHAVESGTGPVDHARYARAASTLLAELDKLNLPHDQAAELRQAAEEIMAETAQPEPDEGKLRRWGGLIVKGLGAVTTSALGGTAARYIVELLGFAS